MTESVGARVSGVAFGTFVVASHLGLLYLHRGEGAVVDQSWVKNGGAWAKFLEMKLSSPKLGLAVL